MTRIDFTGRQFGYLIARELTPKIKGVRIRNWMCDCLACGLSCEVQSFALREGSQASCGCKPGLTVRGFNLAKRLRSNGEHLVKTLQNVADAPDVAFLIEPGGQPVLRADAESAIECKEVVPLADSLFGDNAQTWVPA